MLRDSDYRVRSFVARRIGVLFQTWEGHEEMFQDIWCVSHQYVIFIYACSCLCMLLYSHLVHDE